MPGTLFIVELRVHALVVNGLPRAFEVHVAVRFHGVSLELAAVLVFGEEDHVLTVPLGSAERGIRRFPLAWVVPPHGYLASVDELVEQRAGHGVAPSLDVERIGVGGRRSFAFFVVPRRFGAGWCYQLGDRRAVVARRINSGPEIRSTKGVPRF